MALWYKGGAVEKGGMRLQSESNPEATVRSTDSGHSLHGLVGPAAGLGLYLAAWNMAHETCFLYQPTVDQQIVSCLSSLVFGALAMLALALLGKRRSLEPRPLARVGGTLGVLQVLFDVALFASVGLVADSFLPALPYGLYSAAFFVVVALAVECAGGLDPSRHGPFLVIAFITFGIAEMAYSLALFHGPFSPLQGCAHVALLGLALALLLPWMVRCDKAEPARGAGSRVAMPPVPWQIVAHLLCYFLVLGVMHSLSGELVGTQPQIDVRHLGRIGSALLFWAIFIRDQNRHFWPRIRASVFPLVMLGFILLSSSINSQAPLSVFLTEAATSLYLLVMLLAFLEAARRGIGPAWLVAATGCAVALPVFAAGALSGRMLRMLTPLDPNAYAILCAAAFLVLVAGTFWLGSDREASLFWGMEEKLDPQAFNRHKLEQRCDELARRYRLTRREGEVLLLIAAGKTPDQISREQVVSMATVRSHIHGIHVKLDVHSRSELLEKIEGDEGDEN